MCEEFLYDRNIYFDITTTKLNLLKGERTLIQYNDVEDIKGNPDLKGRLSITNIRVMWWQDQKPQVNLSIGLGTIFIVEQKVFNNNRTFQTIFRTKVNNTNRYEFIFSNSDRSTCDMLRRIQKLYSEAALCHEIKVQYAMITQKKLNLMEREQIINQYSNTTSVANDQKDVVGQLIFTNMRFVWFSNENDKFNISSPWISVKKIQKKTAKGRYTIVVEIHQDFGGYFMGYYHQEMDQMLKEFTKLHLFYTENPNYGIEINDKLQVQKYQFNEQVQIVQSVYNQSRYLEGQDEQTEIIVSPELGIAIEKIPDDVKLRDLWNIIKQN